MISIIDGDASVRLAIASSGRRRPSLAVIRLLREASIHLGGQSGAEMTREEAALPCDIGEGRRARPEGIRPKV
jgi:hypothetical protein